MWQRVLLVTAGARQLPPATRALAPQRGRSLRRSDGSSESYNEFKSTLLYFRPFENRHTHARAILVPKLHF